MSRDALPLPPAPCERFLKCDENRDRILEILSRKPTDRGVEGEGLSRDMGFERDSPSPSAPRAKATGTKSFSEQDGRL
jgi:hypothetical protein